MRYIIIEPHKPKCILHKRKMKKMMVNKQNQTYAAMAGVWRRVLSVCAAVVLGGGVMMGTLVPTAQAEPEKTPKAAKKKGSGKKAKVRDAVLQAEAEYEKAEAAVREAEAAYKVIKQENDEARKVKGGLYQKSQAKLEEAKVGGERGQELFREAQALLKQYNDYDDKTSHQKKQEAMKALQQAKATLEQCDTARQEAWAEAEKAGIADKLKTKLKKDDSVAEDTASSSKTVDALKKHKLVSGSPNWDAKAFICIVMTKVFVDNTCDDRTWIEMGLGYKGAKDAPKHFKANGVSKQLKILMGLKNKGVEPLILAEKAAGMKKIKQTIRLQQLSAPVILCEAADGVGGPILPELGIDGDGIFVMDRNGDVFCQGSIEFADSIKDIITQTNEWLNTH